MSRFEDKVALVTGASSGIGAATARRLAGEGASVFALGRSAEGLESTRRVIEEEGGSVAVHSCDLTAPEACRGAVAACLQQFAKLDVLVNCAGNHQFRPLAQMNDEDWFADLATNLGSAFFLIQAAMPSLLETAGNVVNVGSQASVEGQPYSASYCSAKHGIIGLTKALALEFCKSDVRINAVCPGGTNTAQIGRMAMPEGADIELIMRTAGPRGMSEPEDIAAVIAFVASGDAQSVHGAVYMADRGKTVG